MPKSDYLNPSDPPFAAQLLTFKNAIGGYAPGLGLTPAQVTTQAADADYFDYAVTRQTIASNDAQQWTGWKDLIRGGGTPPGCGRAGVSRPPGRRRPRRPPHRPRFRALVKLIKANPAYSEAMGQALGIEGSQQLSPDYTTLAPVIDLSISGGQVSVNWGWQGFSAFLNQCELQVDRADSKGFVLLAIDTTPGYTDTTPFPSAPAKWTYQAIYRVGDNRVGQWSNPVSIAVGV
jgi:hypothetical protein